MVFVLISFLAGVLSVLAPCVIALLPILLARSADGERHRSPLFVISGLASSVFIFSILLKATTLFVSVPTRTWQIISGLIILLFGITYLFPALWEKVAMALRLQEKANKSSAKALQKEGRIGDVLLGASLGPVFSACSPTYALIIASILPASPIRGILYLLIFIAGLSLTLTAIAVGGSTLVRRLGWGINPNGWFKRGLGFVFLFVGLMILFGLDKQILSYAVENGWFDWQIQVESFLQR